MKILVTGNAGHLGEEFARTAIHAGMRGTGPEETLLYQGDFSHSCLVRADPVFCVNEI